MIERDPEEQEILDAYSKGRLEHASPTRDEIEKYREAARAASRANGRAGIRTRLFADADREAILRINNVSVPAVGALDEAGLKRLLSFASLTLVVAPADAPDLVAGFCVLLEPGTAYPSVNYRWFDERYDDFWYLDRVAVDEPYRSHGLGAALYREVERRARAKIIALEVNVRPRNEGSLRFHRRQGFVEVGQQETNYGARVSLQIKRLAQ